MEEFAQSFYGRAEVYLSSVDYRAEGEAHARISPREPTGHSTFPSTRTTWLDPGVQVTES